MKVNETLIGSISSLFETESQKISACNGALAAIKALHAEALNLDAMRRRETARSDDLFAHKEEKLGGLASARAAAIHRERIEIISKIAKLSRLVVLSALCDEGIDETTAGTGLDDDDRRTIAEVSGRCSRW